MSDAMVHVLKCEPTGAKSSFSKHLCWQRFTHGFILVVFVYALLELQPRIHHLVIFMIERQQKSVDTFGFLRNIFGN